MGILQCGCIDICNGHRLMDSRKAKIDYSKSDIRTTHSIGNYEQVGTEVGKLVDEKNAAYGDSFNKCGAFLKLLYPDGIKLDQYTDMLCIVRMFDKFMRIATNKGAFDESPFRDIAGYALLGLKKDTDAPIIKQNTAAIDYMKG